MGNYENLKQSITEVIRTNGNKEITGAVLQSTLLTIISTVGANATFAGVATPTTNPGTPDGSVFWIASESGTYTNFGSIELQDGLSVLMWNGSWSSQQVFSIDDVPTAGSDNLVKSGGVFKKVEFIENTQSEEENVNFFDKDDELFGTIDDEGFHLDKLTDLDGNPYIVGTQAQPTEEILVENSAFSNIGYIMYNGEVVSDNGYRYTDKIDISSIKNKKNAYLLMNTKTSASICHVRFFNSEDKVILMASGAFENTLTSFENYSLVNGLSNVVMSVCAIPIDAKYVQYVSEYSSSINIKLLTEYRDIESCDFSFSGSNSAFEDTSYQCIINDCTYKKITANNGATVRLDSESYPNGVFSFGIRMDAPNQAKTKLTIKFISNKDRELKICYIEKSDNVDFLPTGKSTICGLSEGIRISYNNSAENLSYIRINVESDDSSEFFIGETATKCEPFKKMPLLILNDGNNHSGRITFTDDNGNTYTDVSQYKVLDVFDIPFGVVASDWSITSSDCNNAINRGIAEKVIYSALYAHQYKTLSTYDMQRTINAYFSSQGTKTNMVVLSSHRSDDDVYNVHRLAGTTMIRLNHNLAAPNIRPLFGDNSVPLCGDTYLLSPEHLRNNYMCIPFIMWTHQIPDGESGADPDGQKLVSFCRMVKQLVKDGYIEVLKPSEFVKRVNR